MIAIIIINNGCCGGETRLLPLNNLTGDLNRLAPCEQASVLTSQTNWHQWLQSFYMEMMEMVEMRANSSHKMVKARLWQLSA